MSAVPLGEDPIGFLYSGNVRFDHQQRTSGAEQRASERQSTTKTRSVVRTNGEGSRTSSLLVSAMTELEHLLRQAKSPNEISEILSSFEPPQTSFADLDDDFSCRCQSLTSDDESSAGRTCHNCTPSSTTFPAGGFTPRGLETKERLKLKFTKRAEQTPIEPAKPSGGRQLKGKPSDNNIDDLVRFIDGQDTASPVKPPSTSKKNKKKKGKGNPPQPEKIETKTSPSTGVASLSDTPVVLKKLEETPAIPIVSSRASTPSEKPDSLRSSFDSPSESFSPSEEEVNWITISRKQTKPKVTIPPTTHSEQKRQAKPAKKVSISQPPVPLLQPTVNSHARTSQQKTTTTGPARPTPSAWATVTSHEPAPGKGCVEQTWTLFDEFRKSTLHSDSDRPRLHSIIGIQQ